MTMLLCSYRHIHISPSCYLLVLFYPLPLHISPSTFLSTIQTIEISTCSALKDMFACLFNFSHLFLFHFFWDFHFIFLFSNPPYLSPTALLWPVKFFDDGLFLWHISSSPFIETNQILKRSPFSFLALHFTFLQFKKCFQQFYFSNHHAHTILAGNFCSVFLAN